VAGERPIIFLMSVFELNWIGSIAGGRKFVHY
jgi:hypothetical protein